MGSVTFWVMRWFGRVFNVSRANSTVARKKKLDITHPGRVLREEFMAPVGLSAYSIAKVLAVPLPRVNDIVRERRGISAEMAVLLSAYFGTNENFWMNLQANYDLELAKLRIAKQVARIQSRARMQRETVLTSQPLNAEKES